jgi:hypothetical protein
MGAAAESAAFPLFPSPNKEHNPILPNSEGSDSLTPSHARKMDPDLIDPDLIFAKTPSGEEAMLQRTRVVQRNTRMVLILVDGNATVAELCDKTGNAQLTENALLELENDGFIERRIEKNSVWRQNKSSPKRSKTATPQPVSEFSTYGATAESAPVKSSLPGSRARRVIPFPGTRDSKPVTPSAHLPGAVTPALPQTGPESRASSLPGRESVAEPLPEPSADTEEQPPSLLERLRALVRRRTAAAEVDLKPLRRGRRRWSLTWPMASMLGVALLCTLVFLVARLFPYTHYLPEVEAALAKSAGRPASVEGMRVSFYPKPGLLLRNVRLGGESAKDVLRVSELRLQPDLGTLLSAKLIFREVELRGFTLSAETIASLSTMLESTAREPNGSGVMHVAAADAEISFAGLALGEMNGNLELAADGSLHALSLQSTDRSLQVELQPSARGVAVRLEGIGWRPSERSPYFFSSLNLQGNVVGRIFTIDTLELRIFDGLVRGATILHADPQPSMAGEIAFERINAMKMGEALGIGGQFEGDATGKLRFVAMSQAWSTVLSSLQATGEFSMHRGSLGGIDLPEAVRRVSTTPATLGGRTRFEDLSGGIVLTPGTTRFSRLALTAGLMQSSGQIEVNRELQLRGRMEVQMRGHADHTAVPILISGTLKSPLLQTAGR